MRRRFEGRGVLLTGAANGLGRLMALQLAAEGARLYAWDCDARGLRALAKEVHRAGGAPCTTRRVDLSQKEEIQAAAAELIAGADTPVDIVINNAGVVSGRAFCELDDRQIELTMAVNAMAPMWVTKAFLPAMMERDSGHIVTVASAAGLLGAPRLVDYCASKHASVGFMEALRVELKKLGSSVCTTTICPGIMDTGMFDGATSPFPLLAILDPAYAATRFVDAIARRKQQVLCPWFLRMGWLARFLLPAPLVDLLGWPLGVTHMMDNFVGHAKAAT